ncbi:MAG: hypothetical protein EOP46_01800 [Sphingobacteriaceae bacterium]|nr:MAG: hypothetical protein EOP46_01800 [Sphingobacteriaceae bacterium]
MEKIIHPFDYPDRIERYLEKLKALNLENTNYFQLTKEIDENLGMMPFSGICIKKGTELFRARKNSHLKGKMFSALSELTIRIDEEITTFGRANTPCKGIFCCSLDQYTAAREVTQWQLDDFGALIRKGVAFFNYHPFTQFMTISKWKTKEDLYFFTAFNDNEFEVGTSNDLIINQFKLRYKFDKERYKISKAMVEAFFQSEFEKQTINGQFDYYFSAYYSSIVYNMAKHISLAGLIYKSVAFDLEGFNFAIPRNKLKSLEFVSADFCYTYNSNGKEDFSNSKILVAPSYRATLDENYRLIWEDVWGKT